MALTERSSSVIALTSMTSPGSMHNSNGNKNSSSIGSAGSDHDSHDDLHNHDLHHDSHDTRLLLGGASTVVSKQDKDHEAHYTCAVSEHPRTGTILTSIFNLTNTIIGAGLLALPYAFRASGLIVGLVLIVASFIMTNYSIRLLVSASKSVSEKTYSALCETAFGKWAKILVDVSIVISTYATAVAYFVVVGDVLSAPISYWMNDGCSFVADRRFPMILMLAAVLPLAMLRKVNDLTPISVVALCSITFMVLMVVVRGVQSIQDYPLDIGSFCRQNVTGVANVGGGCLSLAVNDGFGVFRSMSIMTFAFGCQFNVLTIVGELSNPTRKRIVLFVDLGVGAALVLYAGIGVFGYLAFLEDIRGNVLLNFASSDIVAVIGRFAEAIVLLASFPMMTLPLIRILERYVLRDRPFSWCVHVPLVCATVGTAFVIAMVVDDVSLVFGIAGSTASTLISYILPPMLYLKFKHIKAKNARPYASRKNLLSIGLLLVGVAFFIISTVVTFIPDDSLQSGDPTRITCTH